MWFDGVNIWYNYFIPVEMDPPILCVYNIVPVLAVIADAEPHLFEFLDDEYVINPFLVNPTFNGTKSTVLVGECGTCVAVSSQKYFTLTHICEDVFIVHTVVPVVVILVDPVGLKFFAMFDLMVHQHINSVPSIFLALNNFTPFCLDTPTLLLGCAQRGPILFR